MKTFSIPGQETVVSLSEAEHVVLEWFLHHRAMGEGNRAAIQHIEDAVETSSATFAILQQPRFREYLETYTA